MNRFLTPLLVLACCLLTSCASLVGPRDIELPLAKLQGGLERRFPMNHRLLDIFDVSLTRPQLSLAADGDRIALSLDAAVAPVFLRQSWHGTLAFSGRLVLDPARDAEIFDPLTELYRIKAGRRGTPPEASKSSV